MQKTANNIRKSNELRTISLLLLLSALIYTVYILNNRQNVAPQRSQAVSNADSCEANFTAVASPSPPPPKITRTPTPPTVGCINLGIDEYSQGNCSNIISIKLSPVKELNILDTLYCNQQGICDAEGMDNTGQTAYLVANKNSPAIYRLKVNPTPSPPTLTKVGKLSKKYEGLSFRPGDNHATTVWGGARDNTIYKITYRTTGSTEEPKAQVSNDIKSITWNNAGTFLYVSTGNNLLRYKYKADGSLTQDCPNGVCFNKSLPGKTDGMDMTTDGYIVGGYESGNDIVFYFCNPLSDPNKCAVASSQRVSLTNYNQALQKLSPSCSNALDNLDGFTWLCGKSPM